MPDAHTRIPTERATRYLVQLCEHLDQINDRQATHNTDAHAPKLQRIDWSDTHGIIVFAFGQCQLQAAADSLTIRLTAEDATALQHMQRMFTTRLETIGRRDNLAVTWTDPT